MKSHELANLILAEPDYELIIQKDDEGNGYRPMNGIEFDVVYNPNEGEVYSKENSADDNCMDEEDWWNTKLKHSGYAVVY